MDDRPRNLKTMLSEAKDTSELMVDLAYAALYFGDPDMAEEVDELEERMNELVHDMRAVCVLAARSPAGGRRDGLGAAGHLAPSSASATPPSTSPASSPTASASPASWSPTCPTPRRCRTGCACARARTSPTGRSPTSSCRSQIGHARGGHPPRARLDHRRRRRRGPAARRRAVPAGLAGRHRPAARARRRAGVGRRRTRRSTAPLTDLDRAVDVLVEMKNISEVAVGLAYSALVLRDQGLAAEVSHLEDRLDEMKERLELWVLRGRAGPSTRRRSGACCTWPQAAEELGDAAQQMVWLVEQEEELHPILAIALGEADEVVVRVPVGAGSRADGAVARRAPARHRDRASTCSPSAAAAATSTARAGTCRLARRRRAHRHRPRRGPRPPRRAVRLRVSSRTTTPARTDLVPSGSTSRAVRSVLVVCTANQCRSPMVEALLRHRLPVLEVRSAGSLSEDVPASGGSVHAMAARGLDIAGHRSRRLDRDAVARADLVLALARAHLREVVALDPKAFRRTFTLREVVRRAEAVGDRPTFDGWLDALNEGRRRRGCWASTPTTTWPTPWAGPTRRTRPRHATSRTWSSAWRRGSPRTSRFRPERAGPAPMLGSVVAVRDPDALSLMTRPRPPRRRGVEGRGHGGQVPRRGRAHACSCAAPAARRATS